jgi:hypothetical protein
MTNQEVLLELNKQLDLGHEVGIFVCKYEGGRSYEIIINGKGQSPVCQISYDNYLFLTRNNYLLYGVMTKVGSHWYYEFNEETRNGFTLHKLYKYEDFLFLLNKKFYIVPRGMKKVYYHDELEQKDIQTPIINDEGEEIGYTTKYDYDFTKIKEHATVYDIEKLFINYMYRKNPLYMKTYCTSYADVGCYGGRREVLTQNCDYYVEQSNGEIIEVAHKYKDFDLLTIDGLERYKINDVFDHVDTSLGNLGSNYYSEEEHKKRQDSIKNDPRNFFVSFGISISGGSMFSLGTPYYRVDYLRKYNRKPFEEYNNE